MILYQRSLIFLTFPAAKSKLIKDIKRRRLLQ
jgi:hypothetical protein